MTTAVRIGNCSGFYGDRHAAMREMLTDGELDYLTGDYLAELTMLILGRDRMKNPERGYAKTFLTQLEECLGLAHDKGVRTSARQRRSPWRARQAALDPAGESTLALEIDPYAEGPNAEAARAEYGLSTPEASGPFAALQGLKKGQEG